MQIWKQAQIQGHWMYIYDCVKWVQSPVPVQQQCVCVCGILRSTAQTLITSPNKQTLLLMVHVAILHGSVPQITFCDLFKSSNFNRCHFSGSGA